MIRGRAVLWIVGFVAIGLTGCSSARYVLRDSDRGIVAIPAIPDVRDVPSRGGAPPCMYLLAGRADPHRLNFPESQDPLVFEDFQDFEHSGWIND